MPIRNAPPETRQRESASLRVHGRIARELGMAIVSGRYRPGELLHGEIDASDRLRVSRTAYREAIRILAAKGLVEAKPKIGTRVSPQHSWHLLDPDVLQWIFENGPNRQIIDHLFELRRIVEPEAAALAATRRTDEQLAAMRQALGVMAAQTLATEQGRKADQDFHATLLAASQNDFLVSLTNGVGAAISLITVSKERITTQYRDPIPDHARVCDAIAAQDAGASRDAMIVLIDQALHDARSVLHRGTRRGTATK